MAHILFIVETAPYYRGLTDEAHDLIMASTAYGHSASVVFTGEGIAQLAEEQQPPQRQKHAGKRIKGFSFFDVEPLYVNATELKLSKIQPDKLVSDLTLIDDKQQRQLIDNADFTVYL